MSAARSRVAATLRAEGGLLAAAVAETPGTLGDAAEPSARDVAVAAIREGHALHAPRPAGEGLVVTEDEDLALLAGDRLYALGLSELARAGDLPAVRVLAEVIAMSAAARGAGDADGAEAAWEQGFRELEHDPGSPTSPDR